MRIFRSTAVLLLGASWGLVPLTADAQGTLADYRRAAGVNQQIANLTVDVAQAPTWIGGDRFWYRKSVKGGNQFVLVGAATGQKSAPFDHARLATALTSAASPRTPFTATTLPFTEFSFAGDGAIEADANGSRFRCTLSDYSCSRVGAAAAGGFGGFGGGGGGGRGNAGAVAASGLPARSASCVGAAAPGGGGGGGGFGGGAQGPSSCLSPDGRLEAFIQNFNVAVRPAREADGVVQAGG